MRTKVLLFVFVVAQVAAYGPCAHAGGYRSVEYGDSYYYGGRVYPYDYYGPLQYYSSPYYFAPKYFYYGYPAYDPYRHYYYDPPRPHRRRY